MPASEVVVEDIMPVHLRVPSGPSGDAPADDVYLLAVSAGDMTAHAEAVADDPAVLAEGLELLSPCVLGASPVDRGAVWERMREMLDDPDLASDHCGVFSALDVALHDLAGRCLGIPTYRLLGGAYLAMLDCHCVARAAADTPTTLQRAKDLLSAGYNAVSIELSGDVAADCALITQARAALSGNVRLMFDACERYEEFDAALEVGTAVDRAEGFWFARPLPEGRWEDYARLRDPLATPLAAGARLTSAREAEEALVAGALDILTLDIRVCGGITGAMRAVEAARLHDARVTFTPLPSTLSTLAAAHCALCTPAAVLFPATAGIPSAWKEMLTAPLPLKGGFLRPPEGSGIGGTVSERFLDQHRAAVG